PTTAVQYPTRCPNPFHHRANPQPSQRHPRRERNHTSDRQPLHFGWRRSRTPQDTARDQAEDHRAQRWDETQSRVAASIKSERFLAWKTIEKPSVESPCRIAVLVPVRSKSAH